MSFFNSPGNEAIAKAAGEKIGGIAEGIVQQVLSGDKNKGKEEGAGGGGGGGGGGFKFGDVKELDNLTDGNKKGVGGIVKGIVQQAVGGDKNKGEEEGAGGGGGFNIGDVKNLDIFSSGNEGGGAGLGNLASGLFK